MRRLARFAESLFIAGWLLLLAGGAARAQTVDPLLDCPTSLDGMPLEIGNNGTYPQDEGSFVMVCHYSENVDSGQTVLERRADAWAMWQVDDSLSPVTEFCPAETIPYPGVPEQTYSVTNKAYSDYSLYTEGPPVDEAAVKELAEQMLGLAEQRAFPCPAVGSGEIDGGNVPSAVASATAGPSSRDTAAVPARPRGLALGLLAGGAVLTVVAGVGSSLVRRGTPATPPPPTDVLYGDEDSIRILMNGGQLETVRGPDGELVGYRPLGDLANFIRNRPQWQQEFGTPLSTPNGRATHLGGVAFQEGPDGLIESISMTVRELPAQVPATDTQVAAPQAAPTTSEEAPYRGDGFIQAVVEPDLDYYRSELATHTPALERHPPKQPPLPSSSPFERQLLQPGNTLIGMKQITQLAPQLFDQTGALAKGAYAGARPGFEVRGSHIHVALPAPSGSPLPSIEVSARLSARDGRLEIRDLRVPPEVRLGAQLFGQPDPVELVKRFQDAFNERMDAAGSRLSGVGSEGEDLLLKLEPR